MTTFKENHRVKPLHVLFRYAIVILVKKKKRMELVEGQALPFNKKLQFREFRKEGKKSAAGDKDTRYRYTVAGN